MKKDYTKSDDKQFNLSLMAGIFVAVVLVLFDLIEELFKQSLKEIFQSAVNWIFWIKFVLFAGLIIWFICQWKHWNSKQRKR